MLFTILLFVTYIQSLRYVWPMKPHVAHVLSKLRLKCKSIPITYLAYILRGFTASYIAKLQLSMFRHIVTATRKSS